VITIVGCHAEGEVGDVIVGGVLPPKGETVFEMMQAFRRDHDDIRRLILCEPRGSVARHVNLIVPAKRPDCDAGAIIMEPTEYPPMSGSNTMCVTTVLLETGMVPMQEPQTRLRLDMPGGPVEVTAECRDGKCVSVELENVPCFAAKLDVPLRLDDGREVRIDIGYGGMFYALLDVTQLGLEIVPEAARRLAELGEEVRRAARAQHADVVHPENPAISGVSIVQLNTPFKGPGTVARNTCIVAPGRSDRSPTGTGLSARLAVLHAKGRMKPGETLTHESIIGSRFEGRIVRETEVAGRPAVVPAIKGRAWITGVTNLMLDPTDPWPSGYVVADTWGLSTDVMQDG
jgi:proline racemase